MPLYVMRVPSFQPGFTGISSTSCAAAPASLLSPCK